MIPKECKRLAEVDFPIAVVSKHAAREKTVRHGHPSTLHLWWARRPLAACRAMLMALLLPDPCDSHCPAEFKKKARQLLLKTRGAIDSDDMGLRQAVLKFIGDCASWDLASDATYLEAAPTVRGRRRRGRTDVSDEALQTRRGATTLDRVHAAMILQASGRSNALRALLKSEVERGPDFLRLANALSALYPAGSDEKRLVNAMLLAVPR